MKIYDIVDENGNEADDLAYDSIVDAGIAADQYARATGKTFAVKELLEVE